MTDTNQPQQDERETAVHKAHCFRVVQPENEFMGCKYGPDEDCPCQHLFPPPGKNDEPVSDELVTHILGACQCYEDLSCWYHRNYVEVSKQYQREDVNAVEAEMDKRALAAINTLRAHDIAVAELRGRIAQLKDLYDVNGIEQSIYDVSMSHLEGQLAQLEGKQNGGSDA